MSTDLHTLADTIIVYTFLAFVLRGVFLFLIMMLEAGQKWWDRRQRDVLHTRWVAARVAAREECESRMKAEGYWDNNEIYDAMKAAGDRVAPGYRV